MKTKKSTRAILLIGAAETCPDLEYASGFRATDPVVLLTAGGRRDLVVPELELGRARRQARRCTVHTPAALGVPRARQRRVAAWALALLRLRGVRAVTVSPWFPHGVAARLVAGGVRVRVEDTLFPARQVKTARELEQLAEAQAAAVAATRAAIALIRESRIGRDGVLRHGGAVLTSELVRRRIAMVLLERECSGKSIIVAGGAQSADPHEVGSGPLRAHTPIVLDIFPQHNGHGYWGDITRTVVRGEAPPELRRMHAAVAQAQDLALKALRPGVNAAEIHRAVCAQFEKRGFATREVNGTMEGFFHGTGHGVGLQIHEAPTIGRVDLRLRRGHVVTVEPGLYYPAIGGVRIEDTVVVTATGWRYLARCEKEFEI